MRTFGTLFLSKKWSGIRNLSEAVKFRGTQTLVIGKMAENVGKGDDS